MILSSFYENLFPFFMINARLTALVMMAPVFGHAAIPYKVKIGIVFMFSLVLHLGLGIGMDSVGMDMYTVVYGILFEFITGAAMGLVLQLYFAAFAYAAGIIAPQMGMAISQLIDPQTQAMQPLLSTFFSLIAVVIFLVVNGHLFILEAFYDSYRIVPLGGINFSGEFIQNLMNVASDMFVIAFRICAPILAVIMFLNTGMAIMARAVPQINVLVVGFIITISVGIFVLSLLLPVYSIMFQEIMKESLEQMLWILRAV